MNGLVKCQENVKGRQRSITPLFLEQLVQQAAATLLHDPTISALLALRDLHLQTMQCYKLARKVQAPLCRS